MDAPLETETVWRQTRDRLFSYIRRRVGTVQDAEDILQEVFLRIHSNLHRLEDTERLIPWVFQIARNAVTDHYRGRAAAARAHQGFADEAVQATAGEPGPLEPDSEPEAEVARCMRPLLAQLPERYRQAVAMTELDGLTQKEAARRLGLSTSGAKARVQRGRRKLKEALLDCCNVELDRRGGVVGYERRDEGACGDCSCE